MSTTEQLARHVDELKARIKWVGPEEAIELRRQLTSLETDLVKARRLRDDTQRLMTSAAARIDAETKKKRVGNGPVRMTTVAVMVKDNPSSKMRQLHLPEDVDLIVAITDDPKGKDSLFLDRAAVIALRDLLSEYLSETS